ncbi:MAG: putative dehydrogenase, partial [Halioglobus sp.]
MTRVIIAGLGNMGISHALAYHHLPEAEIVGLVNRSVVALPDELVNYPNYRSFEEGMATNPDLVVIATYTDSHAEYACAAMKAGAHVFVEKPLAMTVADAKTIVDTAKNTDRKLVV